MRSRGRTLIQSDECEDISCNIEKACPKTKAVCRQKRGLRRN